MDKRPNLFEAMATLAPPPAMPASPGSPDKWGGVERALGTVLPTDYKWLIDTYGVGDFGDLLVVLNPFAAPASMNLLRQAEIKAAGRANPMFPDPSSLARYLEGRERLIPEQCPFPAYPEPGGLLPVAKDTNGNDLFWVTRGAPDSWSLVHYDRRGGWERQEYNLSIVGFLLRWLSGKMPESFFGVGNSTIVRRNPVFRSAT